MEAEKNLKNRKTPSGACFRKLSLAALERLDGKGGMEQGAQCGDFCLNLDNKEGGAGLR